MERQSSAALRRFTWRLEEIGEDRRRLPEGGSGSCSGKSLNRAARTRRTMASPAITESRNTPCPWCAEGAKHHGPGVQLHTVYFFALSIEHTYESIKWEAPSASSPESVMS